MYIDKIDELINNIIDSFYIDIWKNNKIKIEKFKEQGKDINQLILDYVNKLKNLEMISKEHINFLKETIIRYLCYYIYLHISIKINNEDEFIRSIIEISKQENKNIKNFYNSINNSSLFKLGTFLLDTINIINLNDTDKIFKLVKSNPNKYNPIIEFLNDIGNEIVQKLFSKKNVNQIHNIIKSIIFKLIYINQEKKDFLLYLEDTINQGVEYKYITIVLPKTDYIDFASIENILIKTYDSIIIEDVYNLFIEYDEFINIPLRSDQKINELLDKKLIVPIVEDFMRYNRPDTKISVDKINEKEQIGRAHV